MLAQLFSVRSRGALRLTTLLVVGMALAALVATLFLARDRCVAFRIAPIVAFSVGCPAPQVPAGEAPAHHSARAIEGWPQPRVVDSAMSVIALLAARITCSGMPKRPSAARTWHTWAESGQPRCGLCSGSRACSAGPCRG